SPCAASYPLPLSHPSFSSTAVQLCQSPVANPQSPHCTVIVTGVNRSPIAAPPGPVAVPLRVSVAGPAAIASNRIAASTPVPEAPVASAPRASVISIRLPLTCCENVTDTPPARRKLPSCTLRTRSLVGSKISVSVTVESRDASATSSGTVYGPPPTRNVVGPEISTCADPMPDDCDVAVGAAGVARAAAGGVAAGGFASGVGVAAGGVAPAAGAAAPGGFVAAPGGGAAIPGMGSGVAGGAAGCGG